MSGLVSLFRRTETRCRWHLPQSRLHIGMPASCRFAMGVHTLLLLAHSEGESLTSAVISRSTNTNPVVVRRLLCSLSKAGLVQTQKGPRGGARISRGADAITLG